MKLRWLLILLPGCVRADADAHSMAVIDLGVVLSGTVHTINTRITNTTVDSIYVFGVQKSCGCLSASLEPGALRPGESVPLTAQIVVSGETAKINEKLVVQADNRALDGQSVVITARIGGSVGFPAPFGPKTFTSEDGGYGEATIMIPYSDNSMLDELQEAIRNIRVEPEPSLIPVTVDEQASFVDATSDGMFALVNLKVGIAPSSFRGRFPYYYLMFPLPSSCGGGSVKLQIEFSLIPIVNIGDRPVFRWAKDIDTGLYFVEVCPSPEQPDTVIEYTSMRHEASSGISWEVLPGSVANPSPLIVIRASKDYLDSAGAENRIQIPVRAAGVDRFLYVSTTR